MDADKKRIIDLLTNDGRALTVDEISDALDIKTVEDFKNLLRNLNALEDELKLYRTNKNKYMIFNNSNLQLGVLIGNKKGFGFVDIEGDEDVYIAPNNMNQAIHGDRVVVEITSKKNQPRLEGRIVRIVSREFKQMVGEYYTYNNKGYIDLDDDKVKIKIEVKPEYTLGAVDGHKVLVKICEKKGNNFYLGEIVKILGHKNDPGVDILSIAAKYGIEDTFPEDVIDYLDKIPETVSEEDMHGRVDLRNEMIFTIDGDDTKDIDDAISIKKLDNGNYELGVHIADVSYYVTENSPLDKDAYLRGTSVYLADRVIPMLPHKLSNGICSLNPNVDRLSISCVMEIDKDGKTLSADIFESVIRSKKQMTYKNVNSILEDNVVPDGYEEYVETLKEMKELADILRKYKVKRGYIDFDIDESKIIVNEKGEAIDIKLRTRGVGEKLIEDFMIAANEAVATHIYFMELPFVYRVHGTPNEEKIQKFTQFINQLGYKLPAKIKEITPITMQKILESLSDKKEFHILSSLLLRSMQKAVYSTDNIGHFGLASRCYTHFTSPIRRYPDTTVHRLLRTYLFKGDITKATIEHWETKLVMLTEHTSEREQAAVKCEREVDDMKKAEYMEKHIGEEFTGVISSILSFGMFVQLPNLIEGLLRLDDLKDDHYIYDENALLLKGLKHGRVYRLGDEIKVVVEAANKYAHTIDFMLPIEKNNKQNNKVKETKESIEILDF
jgi:ribonuclease R